MPWLYGITGENTAAPTTGCRSLMVDAPFAVCRLAQLGWTTARTRLWTTPPLWIPPHVRSVRYYGTWTSIAMQDALTPHPNPAIDADPAAPMAPCPSAVAEPAAGRLGRRPHGSPPGGPQPAATGGGVRGRRATAHRGRGGHGQDHDVGASGGVPDGVGRRAGAYPAAHLHAAGGGRDASARGSHPAADGGGRAGGHCRRECHRRT